MGDWRHDQRHWLDSDKLRHELAEVLTQPEWRTSKGQEILPLSYLALWFLHIRSRKSM